MLRYFAVLLVLCALVSAQPKKPVAAKPSPLKQCTASVADRDAKIAALQQELDSTKASVANLQQIKTELEGKNAVLFKNNEDIRGAAKEVIANDAAFAGEYKKVLDAYNGLAAEHTTLQKQSQYLVQQYMIAATRNMQIQNQALLSTIWTQQHPPLVIQPMTRPMITSMPTRLQTNCTTNKVGDFVYTNCY